MENDKTSRDSGLSESINISNSESEGFPSRNEHNYNEKANVKLDKSFDSNRANTISAVSVDSGYESDVSYSRSDQEKANEFIEGWKITELQALENFAARDLMMSARAKKGVIDISQFPFDLQCKTLLTSDPDTQKGRDVKSLIATMKSLDKAIKRSGLDPKYFSEFRRELDNYQQKMTMNLSSNEGIKELVNKSLVNELFVNGFYNKKGSDIEGEKQFSGLPSEQGNELLNKIIPSIKLPPELANTMLEKSRPDLKFLFTEELMKTFASGGDGKTIGYLDQSKVTEENIQNAISSINKLLMKENSLVQSKQILQESINKIQTEKNIKVTEKQSNMILERLRPSLANFSYEQLKGKRGDIVQDIANQLVAQKAWYSFFTSSLPISISNLQNIATTIATNYQNVKENNQVNTSSPLLEPIKNIAQERIDNIQKLPRRLDEYRRGSDRISTSSYNKAIIYNQAMHSILGLDAENFANSLSNQKTEALLKQLNSNTQYIKKNFLITEAEKSKTSFYMADTEAQLKGFNLSKMLMKYPGDKEEREFVANITKQAMLELQGKQIPKGKYSDMILDQVEQILRKDSKGFSPEQIQEYRKNIGLGDQSKHTAKELAKLTEDEKTIVSNAIEEVAGSFIKTLDNDNKQIQRYVHSLTIANKTIQGLFTEKKLLIQPNEEDKIKNKLIPSLSTLDLEYLEKNTDNISKSLTKNIAKIGNISWWKRNFTISDKNLDAVVSKLESQEFITSSDQEKPDLSNKILTPAPENRVSAISVTCTKIVNDAIKKVHQNTGKTFNWEERNKIQESLVNGLLNLDDEYLKNNSFKLVEDIAQDLKNNSKSGWFSSKLKISPIKLEKIVDKINIIVGDNNKFNEEKALIFSDANIDNPALADKLSKFLNENNIDINKVLQPADRIITEGNKIEIEDLKLITNKQFIELRKSAPESFDRIMFSKDSKISPPTQTPSLKRRESKNSITTSV